MNSKGYTVLLCLCFIVLLIIGVWSYRPSIEGKFFSEDSAYIGSPIQEVDAVNQLLAQSGKGNISGSACVTDMSQTKDVQLIGNGNVNLLTTDKAYENIHTTTPTISDLKSYGAEFSEDEKRFYFNRKNSSYEIVAPFNGKFLNNNSGGNSTSSDGINYGKYGEYSIKIESNSGNYVIYIYNVTVWFCHYGVKEEDFYGHSTIIGNRSSKVTTFRVSYILGEGNENTYAEIYEKKNGTLTQITWKDYFNSH